MNDNNTSAEEIAEKALAEIISGHPAIKLRYEFTRANIIAAINSATAALREELEQAKQALEIYKVSVVPDFQHRLTEQAQELEQWKQACKDYCTTPEGLVTELTALEQELEKAKTGLHRLYSLVDPIHIERAKTALDAALATKEEGK